MIYILIFVFHTYSRTHSEALTSGAVEFNDKASCQAAAMELQKQSSWRENVAIMCAAKGKKGNPS